MARVAPFEAHTERYERWFARHQAAYESELRALGELLPCPGLGLEIGVGTARFAEPLGIGIGIDPSLRMLRHALQRGIKSACAVAEALPFCDDVFDHVLIVTTICFVDDARSMLLEASRVLKSRGVVVLGFIDRTSHLGRHYMAHQHESVFYREAVFHSTDEVRRLLSDTGFEETTWRQTLTRSLAETTEIEPPYPGSGAGAFVAVRAIKG
jgi:ubiquinone/menaquinone biosynthesis C-methylase UbiE